MYTLISSLTLLGGIIGSTTAYPTQSTLTTQAEETPDSLTSLSTLYTPHPSHPGSLTLLSPQNLGISFPYLLTSTCPTLTTSWSSISHDLLIHLLRLYPSGPTSSPYYTIQHSSSSPSSDLISISETLSLPSTHPDVSFRSTLSLSISSGGADAVSVERISAEDWRSLLGLLMSANSAVMAGTRGEGFGKLEMGGVMPLGGVARRRRSRFAPSDIVFPYFADVKKDLDGEEEEEVQDGNKGLKWSAEWVYYGVVRGDDGVEKVLECAAMPDVELWVGDKERKTEVEKEDGEEEDWKIDL
ncbi:hypothetical protein CJF30_00001174 [Rutstroemia sp. NJR-2017a BBW]|nr:hypothetical protein CJF30_00001174 [Rutstroemia sp. NJR-2017a BBW]